MTANKLPQIIALVLLAAAVFQQYQQNKYLEVIAIKSDPDRLLPLKCKGSIKMPNAFSQTNNFDLECR